MLQNIIHKIMDLFIYLLRDLMYDIGEVIQDFCVKKIYFFKSL